MSKTLEPMYSPARRHRLLTPANLRSSALPAALIMLMLLGATLARIGAQTAHAALYPDDRRQAMTEADASRFARSRRAHVLSDFGTLERARLSIHDPAELREKLGVLAPVRKATGINDDLDLSYQGPPSSAVKIAGHCGALREVASTGGNVAEPHWRAMIGLVKRTVEGLDIAHQWSSGYDGYDGSNTLEALCLHRQWLCYVVLLGSVVLLPVITYTLSLSMIGGNGEESASGRVHRTAPVAASSDTTSTQRRRENLPVRHRGASLLQAPDLRRPREDLTLRILRDGHAAKQQAKPDRFFEHRHPRRSVDSPRRRQT